MSDGIGLQILKIIEEKSGKPVRLTDKLEDTDIDSLDFACLCMEIEDKYNLKKEIKFDYQQRPPGETTPLRTKNYNATVYDFIQYIVGLNEENIPGVLLK